MTRLIFCSLVAFLFCRPAPEPERTEVAVHQCSVSWYGSGRWARRYPAIVLRGGKRVSVGGFPYQCAVAIQETLRFPLGSVIEVKTLDNRWQKVIITDVGYLGSGILFDFTPPLFRLTVGNTAKGIGRVDFRAKWKWCKNAVQKF